MYMNKINIHAQNERTIRTPRNCFKVQSICAQQNEVISK